MGSEIEGEEKIEDDYRWHEEQLVSLNAILIISRYYEYDNIKFILLEAYKPCMNWKLESKIYIALPYRRRRTRTPTLLAAMVSCLGFEREKAGSIYSKA